MGYLVISRRIGQRIQVGDDVEILISDINDKKVDIAIKAPKSWPIIRRESHLKEQLNVTKNKPRT